MIADKDVVDVDRVFENARKKRKKKQFFYVTKQMAESYDREFILQVTLRDFPIYLLFLITAIIYASDVRDPELYSMTTSLRQITKSMNFYIGDKIDGNFDAINTQSSIWHYLHKFFNDVLYNDYYYDIYKPIYPVMNEHWRGLLYSNILVGVPRIRQVRTKPNSCTVLDMMSFAFQTCYDHYSSSSEDEASFGSGSAFEYKKKQTTLSISVSGLFDKYGGGGFFKDFDRTRNGSQAILKQLMETVWINRGTRAVILNLFLYNTNKNFVSHLQMLFEINTIGGLRGRIRCTVMRNRLEESAAHYVAFIYFVFIVYFIFEEVIEMGFFKLRYFLQIWTYIDVAIIVLAGLCFMPFLTLHKSLKETIRSTSLDEYPNLEKLFDDYNKYVQVTGVGIFLQYIKIFKYINVYKPLGQINTTIKKCALELFIFSVMFFIIFTAYADVGVLLFGEKVLNYATLSKSLFTLFRTIFGDFSYDEIRQTKSPLAAVYFISFIILVFFILLNMFLAILNDSYSEVKTELAIAPDQVGVGDFLLNLLAKKKTRTKPNKEKDRDNGSLYKKIINQIQVILSRFGFSDMEIKMFFVRYNIDPDTKEDISNPAQYIINKLEVPTGVQSNISNKIVKAKEFYERLDRLQELEMSAKLAEEKVSYIAKQMETNILET